MGWQTAACPANAPLHNKNTHHPQRALLDWSHTGVERTCPLAGTHHKRNCAVTGMPNNANQTHGAANKGGRAGTISDSCSYQQQSAAAAQTKQNEYANSCNPSKPD